MDTLISMGRFFLENIDDFDTVFVRSKTSDFDFIFSGLLINYELVTTNSNFFPYGTIQEYKKITLYRESGVVQLYYLKDDVEIFSSKYVLTEKIMSLNKFKD